MVALVVLLYHPQGKLRIVILDRAWQNGAFAAIVVAIYGQLKHFLHNEKHSAGDDAECFS